ncbi:MAG: ABC transporter ATP-binding protein [Actinomycetota bacterium]|nr:ABC transporter ATP-binding protein [Actinomycetota bacterium]
MDAAIQVRGLTKRFGDFTAVDAIDLDVAAGEIYGFLGPNGSGKTTTIRMLCGVITPTGGEASVLGTDVLRDPEAVRRRIGYMSQKFSLFQDLTVGENLRFYSGVYDLSPEKFAERRAYVLEMADLVGRENELTANLSVGWKQRLALGCATIHEPELIFLDEPTSGVDPTARRHFWDLLYDLAASGVTLFVTTHYMDEAAHCGKLAFIYRGKIIASGSPRQIRELMTETVLEVEVDDTERALTVLEKAEGVHDAYLSGAALHANVSSAAVTTRDAVAEVLRAGGLDVLHIAPVDPTIEDVFVHLVTEQRIAEQARSPAASDLTSPLGFLPAEELAPPETAEEPADETPQGDGPP